MNLYIIIVMHKKKGGFIMEQIKTFEVKTKNFGPHDYLSKIRNCEDGKVYVVVRYDNYAFVFDSRLWVMQAYAGGKSMGAGEKYLQFVALAATGNMKTVITKLTDTDRENIHELVEMSYTRAMEMK